VPAAGAVLLPRQAVAVGVGGREGVAEAADDRGLAEEVEPGAVEPVDLAGGDAVGQEVPAQVGLELGRRRLHGATP
jgi:hypothetical protein